MKRGLIASIACLLVAQPAVAEQWVYVATSESYESYYLDFDSVQGTGRTRTVWADIYDEKGHLSYKNKYTIDCSYGGIGVAKKYIYSRYSNYPTEGMGYHNSEAPPGTVGKAIVNYICERITHQPPASTYVPAYTPTPTYTESKAHCGDYFTAAPGEVRELWPVYVDYSPQLLSYIKNSMCRDAFVKTVEGGYKVIQVSSHTSYNSAERMANKMYSRVGSGFVGISVVRKF